MRRFAIAVLLIGFVTPAWAQTSGVSIHIEHSWSRATAGKSGVVYLTIKNTGSTDDKLVAAATPIAAKAELHTEVNDNGVMKMRPLGSIEIKAGGQTELKPGGMHLMLLGLKHPLREGQSFPLTLTFEKAGKVELTVSVGKAGAMDDMSDMKM